MLHAADTLRRMTIHATDGELGRINEFYFDDSTWTLRYFVVRTGSWLAGHDVLLTPQVAVACDWDRPELRVSLTVRQVLDSPDVSTDRPVSRLQEIEFLRYYNQAPYWMLGTDVGGASAALDAAMHAAASEAEAAGAEPPSHLRSSDEVRGYKLHATDGGIGRVCDYLLDDDWRVRYLVIETGRWWSGHQIIVSPAWVERVSWGGQCLHTRVTLEQIRSSPAFEGADTVTSEYEARLALHYEKAVGTKGSEGYEGYKGSQEPEA